METISFLQTQLYLPISANVKFALFTYFIIHTLFTLFIYIHIYSNIFESFSSFFWLSKMLQQMTALLFPFRLPRMLYILNLFQWNYSSATSKLF